MTKTGYSAVNVVTGYMKIALTYKMHCIITATTASPVSLHFVYRTGLTYTPVYLFQA